MILQKKCIKAQILGVFLEPNLIFDVDAAPASIELEKYIFILKKLSKEMMQAIL